MAGGMHNLGKEFLEQRVHKEASRRQQKTMTFRVMHETYEFLKSQSAAEELSMQMFLEKIINEYYEEIHPNL